MKLTVRIGPVAVACALLVANCGGEPESAPEGRAASAGVSIEHKYGVTEITKTPERIVTVGLTDHDALLALGVAPIGVTEWFGEQPHATWPWATDELGDAEPTVVGDAAAINFEAIAALRPDAILALYGGLTKKDYETLSKIAPTVAQPGEYVDYGIPWDELTRTVGRVVGKSEQADRLVANVEERFAEVREEYPEFVGASAVMTTSYEGIYVYGPEDPRSRLLGELGFDVPEWIGEVAGNQFGGNLSAERAGLLDVDVIVWLDAKVGQGPLANPVYSSLAVHEEGREIFLDSFNDPLGAATSFVSVLSLPFLLDGLTPMLAAAADGDPATEVDGGGG
jgi:iron complex transport system substrate-binding protein